MKSYAKDKITLCGIATDAKWLDSTLRAIVYSKRTSGIPNAQLLSTIRFEHPEVKCIIIDEIKDLEEYNLFYLKKYNKYINTEFLLNIHDDGFILNSDSWTDDFLNYDYIGALWPINGFPSMPIFPGDKDRCGNGAFSLRSKKLLEVSEKYCPVNNTISEDVNICRENKTIFLQHGIKYAPYELASRFSIEHPVPEAEGQNTLIPHSVKSFGFHFGPSPLVKLKNNIIL